MLDVFKKNLMTHILLLNKSKRMFILLNQQLNRTIIYFVQMMIQENLKMILMLEHINFKNKEIIG